MRQNLKKKSILICSLLATHEVALAQNINCSSFSMSDVVLGETYKGLVHCPRSGVDVCLSEYKKNGLDGIVQTVSDENLVYLLMAKNDKVKTFDDFNHYVKIGQTKFGSWQAEGNFESGYYNFSRIINGSNTHVNEKIRSVCWGECVTERFNSLGKRAEGGRFFTRGTKVRVINGLIISYDEANNSKFSIKMKCDTIGNRYISQRDKERAQEVKKSTF